MSFLPDEITGPIMNFLNKNAWIILILLFSIIVGYVSVLFLGKNNVLEIEVEKVIEQQTGIQVNLTV